MNKTSDKPVTQSQFSTAMKRLDLKFVHKTEFRRAMKKIDERFEKIDERFAKIDERFEANDKRMDTFATKNDLWAAINGAEERLSKRMDEIEEKMYTKDDHNKLMAWIDQCMIELQDARIERKLSEHQMLRLDDKVHDHEKRIIVPEKSPR